MKNIENLNDIFNINPMDETENTNLPSLPENLNATKAMDQEDDYQLARQTMRKLLLKGEDTLEELISLSKIETSMVSTNSIFSKMLSQLLVTFIWFIIYNIYR
jgi:hypothetical protein